MMKPINFEGHSLVSDQVEPDELAVIMRELRKVLASGVDGDVVDLGCYEGTTSLFLQRELKNTDKQLWLYDSFEGLPEKTKEDSSPAGFGFKQGELNASKSKLIENFKKANLRVPRIKKCWFNELSPADLPDKICFAFLDGDYYESIKDSLKLVYPKMQKGGVILVDDYANEKLPGAAKATREFCNSHSLKVVPEKSLGLIKFA